MTLAYQFTVSNALYPHNVLEYIFNHRNGGKAIL